MVLQLDKHNLDRTPNAIKTSIGLTLIFVALKVDPISWLRIRWWLNELNTTLLAFLGYLLVALVDIGLDHDGDDAGLALAQLVGNDLCDLGLVAVVFVGVACIVLVLRK